MSKEEQERNEAIAESQWVVIKDNHNIIITQGYQCPKCKVIGGYYCKNLNCLTLKKD